MVLIEISYPGYISLFDVPSGRTRSSQHPATNTAATIINILIVSPFYTLYTFYTAKSLTTNH